VQIERVQIVASMNADKGSAGRFPVSPRLLAIAHVVSIGYPDKTAMAQVYATLFRKLLQSPELREGRQYDEGRELATFATTLYEKIKKRFAGEEYRHCMFCPRDVTLLVANVRRYDLLANGSSLLHVLAYEASRVFMDRLPRLDDRTKADKILTELLASIGFAPPTPVRTPP